MQNKLAFLIVRIGLGISMFGHGLVRLPKLETFSQGMLKTFENSMLPEFLTLPFSYALPIFEFLFGLLLLLGLYTRVAAVVLSAVLISLIFGSTLVENWNAINAQLIHLGFAAYIIYNLKDNSFAVDSKMNK
ncbi:DoxX family membrane protein [Flavobacterium algicola]|uniref:DoxX family membrane protein n=1 Tax=Flavobacterium algicola TaxID=556529 RepID=UPI001EFCE06A|nr:DoxX family membrane protein [Flavobacterium algicola]MCG9792792.1 DoxX family membrane protein [Flavobacterium algicola]